LKHWTLLSYDVREEKRLRKVAKTLEGYGTRIQYSVFRCHLTDRQLERLRWELTRIMSEEDSLLIIALCSQCVSKIPRRSSDEAWPDSVSGWMVV